MRITFIAAIIFLTVPQLAYATSPAEVNLGDGQCPTAFCDYEYFTVHDLQRFSMPSTKSCGELGSACTDDGDCSGESCESDGPSVVDDDEILFPAVSASTDLRYQCMWVRWESGPLYVPQDHRLQLTLQADSSGVQCFKFYTTIVKDDTDTFDNMDLELAGSTAQLLTANQIKYLTSGPLPIPDGLDAYCSAANCRNKTIMLGICRVTDVLESTCTAATTNKGAIHVYGIRWQKPR